MPRLLFLFTGGTISMRIDPATGKAVPAMSGHEVLAHVPRLGAVADAEVVDVARLPGPHMTPPQMMDLSDRLNRSLDDHAIDGAVITHGTDTLEETAYLLDLRLRSPKPVAVVGALRNSSQLGWDGPANLHAAARVAVDLEARGRGVLVVMNDLVHTAAEATKADTHAVDAFHSPAAGPVAMVDCDRVVWRRPPLPRLPLPAERLELRVDVFLMAAGVDGRLLDHAVGTGTQGLVIAGTGRGNVPPAVVPSIQRALDLGLPVVMSTRVGQGRVLDSYGYEGSAGDLRRRGVLMAGSLSPQKARIRLMLALGLTRDPADLRRCMEGDEYNGGS